MNDPKAVSASDVVTNAPAEDNTPVPAGPDAFMGDVPGEDPDDLPF
jgi:hypothetical protein